MDLDPIPQPPSTFTPPTRNPHASGAFFPCTVLAAIGLLGGASWDASAQTGVVPEAPHKKIRPDDSPAPAAAAKPAFSLWTQPTLTGEWGGLRTRLREHGVHFFGLYQAVPLANLQGGIESGANYQGLAIASLTVNFDKMLPWEGTTFRATTFYPHGSSPSRKYVGDLLFVSNIDLYDSLTLWDLWVEQEFLQKKLALRVGQWLPAEEIASGDFAGIFINANFSRLGLLGMDYISYPIPSQGARLRWNINDRFYFQSGFFDGNPDPTYGTTYLNDSGTRINFGEGLFTIHEFGYKVNQQLKGTEHPGTYKVGLVYHSGDFTEFSTAAPQKNGSYAFYGAINQVLWWEKDENDKMKRAIGVNFRVGAASPETSFVSTYFDVGLGFPGIVPGRPDDVLASAFAFAKISPGLRGAFSQEMVWETTYKFAISPWWSLQPTVKYVMNPGATGRLDNAIVAGVRTTFVF